MQHNKMTLIIMWEHCYTSFQSHDFFGQIR
jgi:hypothetical protein